MMAAHFFYYSKISTKSQKIVFSIRIVNVDFRFLGNEFLNASYAHISMII